METINLILAIWNKIDNFCVVHQKFRDFCMARMANVYLFVSNLKDIPTDSTCIRKEIFFEKINKLNMYIKADFMVFLTENGYLSEAEYGCYELSHSFLNYLIFCHDSQIMRIKKDDLANTVAAFHLYNHPDEPKIAAASSAIEDELSEYFSDMHVSPIVIKTIRP